MARLLCIITFAFLWFCVTAQPDQSCFKALPVKQINYAPLEELFTCYEVFNLDLNEVGRFFLSEKSIKTISFEFTHHYKFSLELVDHDLRGAEYFTNDGHPRSKNIYYKGLITSGSRGIVNMTVHEDFIYATFKQHHREVFIEPLRNFIPGVSKDLCLIYDASNVLPQANNRCFSVASDALMDDFLIKSMSNKNAGACYDVEIALVGDNSMLSKYGSSGNLTGHLNSIIANVQTNYDNEFDDQITFVIVGNWYPSGPDPWTNSTEGIALLDDFRDWANGGNLGFNYDIAQLWTDRTFDDQTVGWAYKPGTCTNSGYSTCSDYSASMSFLRQLSAHEIGHNFNASHDGDTEHFIMSVILGWNEWSGSSTFDISSYIAGNHSCLSQCTGGVPPPIADFFTDDSNICQEGEVHYIDNSQYATEWYWSFPGGIPSSSMEQNPVITYPRSGRVWCRPHRL